VRSLRFLEEFHREKYFFSIAKKKLIAFGEIVMICARRRENLRSRAMASRATSHDRAIGAKNRARDARSFAREISFSIRALRDKFFCALVLFTK
jgi:hypothetical protein